MKITVCGSMSFAQKMLTVEVQLQKLGHEVIMPIDVHEAINNPEINMDHDHCDQLDVTMDHFKKIEKSDAILVLNYPKGAVNGYVGGASLMEMGLAYYLGKKIFIFQSLPTSEQLRYVAEIIDMKPIIINKDLSLIQ